MRLGWQLSLGFLLVVAIALGGGGTLLLRTMRDSQLEERSRSLLTQANAAANLAVAEGGRDLTLAFFRFQQSTGARPVLVDAAGRVVADVTDSSPLLGVQMTHAEVAAALAGRQETGTRWLADGGWVMYGAVPVYRERQQVGALLVSADINHIDRALRELGWRLGAVAAGAGALAMLLGLGLARYLSRPLVRLSVAAGQLAAGRMDARVQPSGSLEVAELGRTFNTMAGELGRLDQQRRAFVADASHEMRTPIASIRALAEGLLADTRGDVARYKEYLGDIVHDCDRAARLVDRLLELARLDRRQEARTADVWEPVDLREPVGEVVQALRSLADERGVVLTLSQPAEALFAAVDPRLVETVVGNLVENALKYTPAGGRAAVSLKRESGQVMISVTDTGPGIAAEHLPHIFERFYRIDKARARATGGAGLGLSIAAGAASLLGGRITVESEVGKGTCFTLVFPL